MTAETAFVLCIEVERVEHPPILPGYPAVGMVVIGLKGGDAAAALAMRHAPEQVRAVHLYAPEDEGLYDDYSAE